MFGDKKPNPEDIINQQVEMNAAIQNSQFISEKTEYGTDIVKALVEQYAETGTQALKNIANTTGNMKEAEIEVAKTRLKLAKFIENECMFPRFMKKGSGEYISDVADDISLNIALSKNRSGGFLKAFTQQVRKIFTSTKKKGDE